VMVALAGPSDSSETAAPQQEGGPPPDRHDRMMGDAAQRAQMCKEMYARKVGDLAFLEAKLSPSANQAPLFARWKEASLDVAKKRETDCAAREPRMGARPGPVDRLAMEEELLKKRLADIQAERPALAAFYDSLTPAQKEEFGHGDMRRMAGRMRMMMGMMGHPGMGPDPMRPMEHGPIGEAPPPPPAQ